MVRFGSLVLVLHVLTDFIHLRIKVGIEGASFIQSWRISLDIECVPLGRTFGQSGNFLLVAVGLS